MLRFIFQTIKILQIKNTLFKKGIKMIKEKTEPLIKVLKQRIKYLEVNDPHNETLEVLRHHVSEQDWKILPT